ncbi:MAG: energy-coupling factor transporter transmembrane protein EcfT [Oscillospiraceae bacterium]|nr:energy-coupling factor transporter transmembrane protein EcfT [Oscillospiraceae bacterium]
MNAPVLSYVPGNSFFHRLHPLTKLFWAILTGVFCFVFSDFWLLGAVIAVNVLIIATSGIVRAGKPVYKLFALLAVLMTVFQLLLNKSGEPLFYFITTGGVEGALYTVLRMLGSLLPLSMMIMLTPASDLASELTAKLKVPYKYAFAVTAVLRFIPLLTSEMGQIVNAQASRGCTIDKGNFISRFRKMLPLTIPLLVSAVRRTEKTGVSMELRGFGSDKRRSRKVRRLGGRDVLVFLIIAACYMVGIFGIIGII